MTFQQLRVFSSLCANNSFAKAASELNISVAAISQSLQALENHLGTVLLIRPSGRRKRNEELQLTGVGKWLRPEAHRILTMSMGIERYCTQFATSQLTQLSIGASQTVGSYWLPGYLYTFSQKYPAVETSIHIGNTQNALNRLVTLQDHIALVEGAVDNEKFAVYPFRDDPLIVVAHPDYDANAAIHELSWITREQGSGTKEKTDQLWQQLGIIPSKVMILNNNEAVLQSVAAGLGIALVPQVSATNLLDAGLIKPIFNEYKSLRKLNAVVYPAMQNHPLVLKMLTILRD